MRLIRHGVVLNAFMICVAAGCDPAPALQSSPAAPAATKPAIADSHPASQSQPANTSPAVKLLSPGQGALRQLRYTPTVGEKQEASLTIKLSTLPQPKTGQFPGQVFPTLKLTLANEVQSIAANGDITYVFKILEGDALDTPDAIPEAVKLKRQLAQELVGLTGVTTIDNRGIIKHSNLTVPPKASNSQVQILLLLGEALEQTWTMLPAEPVGIGGKWQASVVTYSNAYQAKLEQTLTYEIVSMDSHGMKLSVSLDQVAHHQDLKKQGDARRELDAIKGIGAGEFILNLGKILPQMAKMSVESITRMSAEITGRMEPVEVHKVVEHLLESVPE